MVDLPSDSLDGDGLLRPPSPPSLHPHRTIWSYFALGDDEAPSPNTTSPTSPNKRRRLFGNTAPLTGTNDCPSDNELVAVFPPAIAKVA